MDFRNSLSDFVPPQDVLESVKTLALAEHVEKTEEHVHELELVSFRQKQDVVGDASYGSSQALGSSSYGGAFSGQWEFSCTCGSRLTVENQGGLAPAVGSNSGGNSYSVESVSSNVSYEKRW